jgi:hypothetical protein
MVYNMYIYIQIQIYMFVFNKNTVCPYINFENYNDDYCYFMQA